MNEQQTMLSEMSDRLFAELTGAAPADDAWQRIEELALPSLLVAEASGGFGGNWDDARIVFRLAGYHALAVPVVEGILAGKFGAQFGLDGRGTVAQSSEGTLHDGKFSGVIFGAAESVGADYIVAPAPGSGSLVLATAEGARGQHVTLSGETRDRWQFDGVTAQHVEPDIFALGAFARTAQIAGALDAALAIAVTYVNDRQQFGRPLAKFQAVQHSLATFACEAAAANCAAVGAAQALDRGPARFEIAAAKLRANLAVGVGAAIAHQVHGAIGFTQDYPLHHLTRRLWSWRSEFGGDSKWAAELGASVAAAGADRFWPALTAL